jgi:hypothetical protein
MPNIDNSTPTHQSEYLPESFDGGRLGLRVESHDHSTRSSTHPADPYGPNDTPEAILKPVQDRVDFLSARLGETTGKFDSQTGRPIPVVQGSLRAVMERELDNLLTNTLPHAKRQAADAAAWHAQQPTTADKLHAQLDRRDAIKERADAIADEHEAQQAAERVIEQRRKLGL